MLMSGLFRALLLAAALGAMPLSARADAVSLTDIGGVLVVLTGPFGGPPHGTHPAHLLPRRAGV